MPVLTLQNGERAGAAFPFDRPVVLGRGRRADIVVDDPSASRQHAKIDLHGRDWQLNDLESANGKKRIEFYRKRHISKRFGS